MRAWGSEPLPSAMEDYDDTDMTHEEFEARLDRARHLAIVADPDDPSDILRVVRLEHYIDPLDGDTW